MFRIIKLLYILPLAIISIACSSDDHTAPIPESDSIYIIGASIAYPENGWFEMSCDQLDMKPINRALSGSHIGDSAVAMSMGLQFMEGEHDRFDIFTIMHVTNLDVCDPSQIKEDHNSYVLSPQMNSTQAFDYVIKRYIEECRALEFNPNSKWYGYKDGKPVHILLCTYWHDARTAYNESIRRLCKRWEGICTLCEFDKNIGFSKDTPDANGIQESVKFAQNDNGKTEVIDGITYGWHPARGKTEEIQQRMAKIFTDAVLGIK